MKKIVQVPVTRLVILQIMKRMIKQEDTPKSNNKKSQSLMRTKFSPITKPIKGARKMKYLVSFTYTYIVIINNSYTFYIFKSPFSFTPFAKLLILAVLSS